MKKQMLTLVVVLAVLWVAAQALPSFSQSKAPRPTDDVAGKTVLVYAPSVAGGRYHVITNVQLVRLGERTYLSGIGADTGQPEKENWEKGLPVRITMDYIAAYYPLTQEEYQALQKRGLPKKWPETR